MLLAELDLGPMNLDVLAVQLTAAIDGPLLLYLSATTLTESAVNFEQQLTQAWKDLIERVCRPDRTP